MFAASCGCFYAAVRINTSLCAEQLIQMSQKDPCQKEACAIQKCLQANKYIESRCEDVIRAMRRCCEAHSGVNSVCCSGFARENKDTVEKTGATLSTASAHIMHHAHLINCSKEFTIAS